MGGNVTVRLNLNAAGYSAAMTKAQAQMRTFASATQAMGHSTVSSMQASSAAIRVLEGGMTGNIRAAERFISTLPGVGKALQAAFPVVGGIALAGVFVRIGEEAYRAIKQVENLRNVAREGFLSMSESAMKSADSLRVANDKLEEQIALLEHKTPNTVQTALDEARVAADDLAASLGKDYTELKKLLDASHGGILGIILGKGVSPEASGGLQDRFANIHTLGLQAQRDTRSGDTAGAADLNAKMRAAQEELLKWTTDQVAMRQGRQQYQPDGTIAYAKSFKGPSATYASAHPGEDQGITTDALQSAQDTVLGQMDAADQRKRDISDQAQQKKDEAANKATEAAKKAQALLLKQDEEALKKQNAFNRLSIQEEINFWTAKITAFTSGGEQFIAVQDKIYDLMAKRPDLFSENKKNQAEAGKSAVEGSDLLDRATKSLVTQPALEQAERATRSAEKYNEIMAQASAISAKNASALSESSIAIGLQEGTISKLAAAQELAAVHANDHAAALAAVNRELATQIDLINSDPKLSAEDKTNAIRNATSEAGNRSAEINGAYAVTQQSDAANIYAHTSSGEAADMYRTMLQNWSDMTANIAQAMVRAADSLNDDLAKLITGQGKKGDFGHTLTQAGGSLVKTALQGLEGRALSALGLGGKKGAKPDGTKDNRIYTSTVIEGGGGTTPGGAPAPTNGAELQGMLGKTAQGLFGGSGGDSSSLASMLSMLGLGGSAGGAGDSISAAWGMFGLGGAEGAGTVGGVSSLLGMGGEGAGALSGLFGSLGAAAGGAGDAVMSLLPLLAFADGGDVLANHPALIGERGPELFVPHTAGRIIPNHMLGSGGGDTNHYYQIDARGATDPAAVHAAVARALPHAVAASLQAQHQQAKRTPSGR